MKLLSYAATVALCVSFSTSAHAEWITYESIDYQDFSTVEMSECFAAKKNGIVLHSEYKHEYLDEEGYVMNLTPSEIQAGKQSYWRTMSTVRILVDDPNSETRVLVYSVDEFATSYTQDDSIRKASVTCRRTGYRKK